MSYLLIIILSQIVITYIAVWSIKSHVTTMILAIAKSMDINNEVLINGIRSAGT